MFCTFALALFLVASVSAGEITQSYEVTVNGITVLEKPSPTASDTTPNRVSVVAGEEAILKVYFTSFVADTDVVVKATIEGEKVSFDAQSGVFDVEVGNQYVKALVLEIPYELKDELSGDVTLSIKIDGKDHKTTLPEITLRVQRPSYNVAIGSITTPSSITAGQEFPTEIVLKNVGYNNLDDVYVTVSIPELGITQGPKWFGDLVSVEVEDEDEDSMVGTLYLNVPYDVKPGVYDLKVVVQNDDVRLVQTKQILITNDFAETIFVTNSVQNVAIGEVASYDLLIVNPTNNVKVYRIDVDGGVLAPSQTLVAVAAGSSASVKIMGSTDKQGSFTFNVNVFDGNKLVKTVPLQMNVEGKTSPNAIVVLTIVLAVIFLVLLAVLIVLLGRKPEKSTTEDFGESYY